MKKALKIFAGCMVGAFVTAIAFVVTMTLSLPKSDMAHGQMPFQDPLVFPIMSMGAGIAGIVVFPFAYLALRTKNIIHCAKIAFPLVLPATVILTICDIRYGLCGSFASAILALGLCALFGRKESAPNNLRRILRPYEDS